MRGALLWKWGLKACRLETSLSKHFKGNFLTVLSLITGSEDSATAGR